MKGRRVVRGEQRVLHCGMELNCSEPQVLETPVFGRITFTLHQQWLKLLVSHSPPPPKKKNSLKIRDNWTHTYLHNSSQGLPLRSLKSMHGEKSTTIELQFRWLGMRSSLSSNNLSWSISINCNDTMCGRNFPADSTTWMILDTQRAQSWSTDGLVQTPCAKLGVLWMCRKRCSCLLESLLSQSADG